MQLPVCWIFCLPWFFSLFVCHSPSQSWTSSIGFVSLESRSRSWTSKSWSWSWNCWVLVSILVLYIKVLILVLVLFLGKQVLNPSLRATASKWWTFGWQYCYRYTGCRLTRRRNSHWVWMCCSHSLCSYSLSTTWRLIPLTAHLSSVKFLFN